MYEWQSEAQMEDRGCNGISRKALLLNHQMRLLWGQHVYWTRLFISGTIFDSPDVKVTEERLLRNPKDFAEALAPFYGKEAAAEFEKLFTDHLAIAGELVGAAKAGNEEKVAAERKLWYENADQIAAFLARLNPYWLEERWREMFYRHLEMTEQEAVDFILGDYAASVAVFERIEQEAMEMADVMTGGIVLQF